MMKFTELESEYIRTRLYGPSRQRRTANVLLPLLEKEGGAARIEEIKKILQEIVEIGQDAVKLAESGKTEDSMDYDQLEQRTEKYRQIAHPWMRKCFLEQNAEIPGEDQRGEAQPVASPQQQEQVDLSSLNDLAKIMAGNAIMQSQKEISPILPIMEWPQDWKKPEYNYNAGEYSPARTSGQCMYQYCFYGLRGKSESTEIKMGEMLEQYLKWNDDLNARNNAQSFADQWLKKAHTLMKEVLKSPNDPALQLEVQKMKGPLTSFLKKKLEKQTDHAERAQTLKTHVVTIAAPVKKQQTQSSPAASAKTLMIPSSSSLRYTVQTYSGHQNDIFSLKPAAAWHLFIDESGKDEDFVKEGKGVIAGVLTDLSNPLPKQPQLHASTDKTDELMTAGDKVVETLIQHPQTGVLAIPACAYRDSSAWGELIVSFVDLVLRMLPLGGKKTKLTVFVEGRDPYEELKDFVFMRDACRYQLMHTLPERAKLIDFDIQRMDKTNAWNAYPDIVSHTCFTHEGNPIAKARFSAAGWNRKCFLNYEARELCNLLDYYHMGRMITPADWNLLIQEETPSNFLSALLQSFGEEIRKDVELWKTFLDYFVAHLDSKAIDLRKLGKQVNFLKRYQPEEAKLPPRLRLLWLTAQLAESNHRGSVVVSAMNEFTKLIRDLYEEDAPLTCWATLHLAVTYTNAYEFKKAAGVVKNYLALIMRATWGKMLPSWVNTAFDVLLAPLEFSITTPAAIPGLQYFAQLISSHGQHEAFAGHNAKAVKFFCEANRLFAKLSNDGGKDDISQTTAYLLTSLMDQASPDPKLLQQTLKNYFGNDLITAAKSLASGDEAKYKYCHHILLRYLLSGKASEDLKKAVLSEEKNWKVGYGHPWEMIEFYRALLVSDPVERMKHLKKAHELSQGYDATLHVIDTVILGSILLEDTGVLAEYKALVEQCVCEVPVLGATRIQVLREQPEQKRAPLELAKLILPFNFR